MNDGDLLAPDDPFLPHVRRAAARDRRAFDWLTDSATAWARGEFVRHVEAGDEDDLDVWAMGLDVLLGGLKGQQVAVLTTHLQLAATPSERRSRWTVHIGVLIDGQMPSDHGYLNLDKGTEKLAGMFDVMDVFVLPEAWRVTPWPKFYEESSLPRARPQTAHFAGLRRRQGLFERDIFGDRAEEIERIMEQASQMTTVVYDPGSDTYNIGGGALVLNRDELVQDDEAAFQKTIGRVWEVCEASEVVRVQRLRILQTGDSITVTTRHTQT